MGTRSAALFVLCVAVAATPARAQMVRGVIRDSVSREPLPGAVVTLSDSSGAKYARTISSETGAYVVARLGGASVLHIQRIGFRPRSLSIPRDSVVDVTMGPIPLVLSAVSATEKRICPSDAREGRALDLWEQARSALLASVVARQAAPPKIRMNEYERTYEPMARRLVDQRAHQAQTTGDRSYMAGRSAFDFASRGYMDEAPSGARTFYAPDEDVMLDPSFVATHCLRVVAADQFHPGEVGLGFEPVPNSGRDTVVDINGVLWLDRGKPALKSLEFSYTGLEPAAKESGGTVEFKTMPNGTPLIRAWEIRSTILAIDEERTAPGIVHHLPSRPDRTTNVRVIGYQHSSGEVTVVTWPDGTRWRVSDFALVGEVQDEGGRPVAGARVWTDRGLDTVVTDVAGHFDFPYATAGIYTLFASDSALASVGAFRAGPQPAMSMLGNMGRPIVLELRPRLSAVDPSCHSNQKGDSGILVGRVVDSAGDAAAAARVELVGGSAGDTARLVDYTDAQGRFTVCGAPLDRPLHVRVTGEEGNHADITVDAWNERLVTRAATLKPPRGGR
jgi:hypothetical protein